MRKQILKYLGVPFSFTTAYGNCRLSGFSAQFGQQSVGGVHVFCPLWCVWNRSVEMAQKEAYRYMVLESCAKVGDFSAYMCRCVLPCRSVPGSV